MSDSKETTAKALGEKRVKLKTTNSYSPFKFISSDGKLNFPKTQKMKIMFCKKILRKKNLSFQHQHP